jgi:hypothetical protein
MRNDAEKPRPSGRGAVTFQTLTPKELESALRLWSRNWDTLEIARVVHRTEAAVYNSLARHLARHRAYLRQESAA